MAKSQRNDVTLQILKSTTRLPQLFPEREALLAQLPDELRLTITATGIAFNIACKKNMILGRRSSNSNATLVDLSPFCQSQDGVSRQHCAINEIYGVLMVQDLDSTNGTMLNKYTLQAYQRYELKSGDTLTLGRLKVTVDFVYHQSLALA